MFSACISLRDPVPQDLRRGNLRSEGRWERLALEALTKNPEVQEIYTVGYPWENGNKVCPKYKGLLRNPVPQNCVLILQDWCAAIRVIGEFKFSAVVVHIFHGPWLNQVEQVKEKRNLVNGNLFFCMGHPEMYFRELGGVKDCPEWLQGSALGRPMPGHLGNFTTSDKFFFLPLPWIPESRYADRFQNKNILWCNRIQFLSDLVTSPSAQWALDKLAKDETLQLRFLTGWPKKAARDHDWAKNITTYFYETGEEMEDVFWKYPQLSKFLSIRSRVTFKYEISYEEVLVEQSNAKLLIGERTSYGGPPLEAAMYGVPFVQAGGSQHKISGALGACPEYLSVSSDKEACILLDRLIADHDFYTKIAKGYNSYAVNTYSHTAFNQHLNNMLKAKGII